MKHSIFSIVFLFIIFSCSESKSKTEIKNKEVVVEDQMTIFEFNDILVSNFNNAELLMLEIWEMDNQDAPEEDIKSKAEEYVIEINKILEQVQTINPVGIGGEAYLEAYIEHLQSYQNIFNIFINYSYILATPDEEWNQKMGEEWMNNAEPIFAAYEISIEKLEEKQANYAVQNNLDIVP